jgi:hypothetical protein
MKPSPGHGFQAKPSPHNTTGWRGVDKGRSAGHQTGGVPELLSSRELRGWDRITDGMRTGEIVGATKKDAWETLFF